MSRIKSFKLFESLNDIELYIKDVMIDLIDSGFRVDIKSSKSFGYIVNISILKKGTYLTKIELDENSDDYGKEVIDYTTFISGSFRSEEVYETFEHIFSYLNTVGNFKSSWIHSSKKVRKSPDEGITIKSEEDFFKFLKETDRYIHGMNIDFFIN